MFKKDLRKLGYMHFVIHELLSIPKAHTSCILQEAVIELVTKRLQKAGSV